MSRMLEALRQIESKQSRPQPPANKSPVKDRPTKCAPVQTLARVETEQAITASDLYDTQLTELHPLIQEELNELLASSLLVGEPIISPPITQTVTSDCFTVEKTLARAETAAASAISPEEPDIYGVMAQYILAKITPGRSAALLFTSPGDCAEKTESLLAISKTLGNILQREVFVLDALPDKSGMRCEKIPYISGGWGHLIEELKTQYQLVLIDAPSLAHAQTAAMISQCDGVYLVIRLGYTTPYDVRGAVRVIEQVGGRLFGSIAVDGG